jgi:hypothetical protein
MSRITAIIALLVLVLGLTPSVWAGEPRSVPGLSEGSELTIRVLGFTRGEIRAEVTNISQRQVEFDPWGLYFIPSGTKSVQRMAQQGSMSITDVTTGETERARSKLLAPGQRIIVRLAVYCIDSHLSYPSDGWAFNVASRRLPNGYSSLVHKTKRSGVPTQQSFWQGRQEYEWQNNTSLGTKKYWGRSPVNKQGDEDESFHP